MRFLSFAPDELQLARMNLAVYGPEGDIQEANIYYRGQTAAMSSWPGIAPQA